MYKPLVLCIMDGVGINVNAAHNAVALAKMPFFNSLLEKYPHSQLDASGIAVGLPENTMGNSEVGHITIGSGRVVNQFLRRFQIENWSENKPLQTFIKNIKEKQGVVHFAGLMSDGRVHSDVNDMILIARHIMNAGLKVYFHFIADGRDTPQKSAEKYINLVQDSLKDYFDKDLAAWASISGRYYAMDRNNNLDRTELAFNAMANAQADFDASDIKSALSMAYERGETDEFVKPTLISGGRKITDKDGFVFGNYRSDRARQIMRAILTVGAEVLCFSQYGEGLNELCPALLEDMEIKNTLGDILAENNKSQLRIAETEKYNHVTYFFDAERNIDFPMGEKALIESPKVATFDLQPEMSAIEITDKLLPKLKDFDVVILNYANGDMVGHTGKEDAAIKAMECLDSQLARLVPAVLDLGGALLITADHGNAEKMWDDALDAPWTAHTTNPVNLIFVANDATASLEDGGLADIAPTMLALLGIKQPSDMTGKILIK